MNELITQHLDLWTTAIASKASTGRGNKSPSPAGEGRGEGNPTNARNAKYNAYGIKKLRELILELAVRGKLVPQDPNDEPASVLLEKIAIERTRLIEEGRIKKDKPQPKIAESEKRCDLPVGWVFVRLGDIAFSQAGFAFKSRFFNENGDGLPLIRIRDVGQPFTGTYYSGEYREEFLVQKGDYLISMDGEFRVSPWLNEQALLNQRVSRLIFFYNQIGQRFIADSLQARLRELQGVKAYTTVDHLSGAQISESVIFLPPLAEQHRIVAKVDELMALCDQLEQQQTDHLAAHQTLVQTLLDTLTQAADAAEFEQAWNRIADHFDTLFTSESSIGQLKQTLLQLAVMGKLVPQNPNDELATELLVRIQIEKSNLIHEGKIKKDKLLAAINEEEKPFKLPKGWEWVRLGVVFDITGGVTLGRKLTGPDLVELPYLRVANVQRGHLVLDSIKTVEIRQSELARYQLLKNDLLVTEGGDWDKVGRTAIWNSEIDNCLHQNHIFRMRGLTEDLSSSWVEMYMNSVAKAYFQAASKQTTNLASINMTQLKNCLLAVPAFQEQHRIVAKIEELMALCDALKARIAAAQTTQLQLADTIVEQAEA